MKYNIAVVFTHLPTDHTISGYLASEPDACSLETAEEGRDTLQTMYGSAQLDSITLYPLPTADDTLLIDDIKAFHWHDTEVSITKSLIVNCTMTTQVVAFEDEDQQDA